MRTGHGARCLLFAVALSCAGCDAMPGKPDPADKPLRPDQVSDFDTLYATRCAGCHGEHGRDGAARPLADAVYLAWAGDAVLAAVIRDGVPDTAMPGFGKASVGGLTEKQIEALVDGMRGRWGKTAAPDVAGLPPYRAASGDVAAGARVFAARCASCHGADGRGGDAGSVVDPRYLALVSDQALRSAVVAGRTDLGMGDWRSYTVDGSARVMSAREVADVVAWLASHRGAEIAALEESPR